MNDTEVRIATCPEGHMTPIPLSMHEIEAATRIVTEMDAPFLHIACIRCKGVYKALIREMKPVLPTMPLPRLPDGVTLRVFYVPIGCDDPGCEFPPLLVAGIRRSDTSEQYETEAPSHWRWAQGQNTKCLKGDEYLLPPYR
jgi:hypothetical protein